MTLFQQGDFTLHSGLRSAWKIECDALTDADLETLAVMLKERLPPFKAVVGIPRGGLRIARHMEEYVVGKYLPSLRLPTLIVDDVCTTGGSLNQFRLEKFGTDTEVIGAVLFARPGRGGIPHWVYPLFTLQPTVGER